MVTTSKIIYSNGDIISGAICVPASYQGRLLQIEVDGQWCDVGKVLSNGMVGFKKRFNIGAKQNVQVRIWKGDILGSVYLG